MLLNEKLIEVRLALGKTQVQMAKHLGAALISVGSWERGVRSPSPPFLVKYLRLAAKCGVEIDPKQVFKQYGSSRTKRRRFNSPTSPLC